MVRFYRKFYLSFVCVPTTNTSHSTPSIVQIWQKTGAQDRYFQGLRDCSLAPSGQHNFLVSAASCCWIKSSIKNFHTMYDEVAKIHPEGLTGAVIIFL